MRTVHPLPLRPGSSRALMSATLQISDHLILKNSVGEGRGYGCNIGRIAPMDFTYGSLLTNAGRISIYLGEGADALDPGISRTIFLCIKGTGGPSSRICWGLRQSLQRGRRVPVRLLAHWLLIVGGFYHSFRIL